MENSEFYYQLGQQLTTYFVIFLIGLYFMYRGIKFIINSRKQASKSTEMQKTTDK